MVKILIDGCTRTVVGGMTVPEITTALLSIGIAFYYAIGKKVEKGKELLVVILLAVPTLAALLGQLSRSCEDNLEKADRLTTAELDKPSCVKTYSGLTLAQLAYIVLAVLVSLWARGNSLNGRIMAFWFFVIGVLSWFSGILFGKDCSTTLPELPKEK
jgi:pheromone shutdown protein TraB